MKRKGGMEIHLLSFVVADTIDVISCGSKDRRLPNKRGEKKRK